MKGIKTLFGALAVAGLLAFSFNASAQENGNRDENGKIVRGPYETNGFWDNWFIGIGGGLETSWAYKMTQFSINPAGGWFGEIQVGKWITPSFGVRLKNEVGVNSVKAYNGSTTATAFYGDGTTYWNPYLHFDAMWNISNAFSGYKETRIWDIIPYFQAGVMDFQKFNESKMKEIGLDFAAGFGIINDFRLGKRVDLYLDLSAPIARSKGNFVTPVSENGKDGFLKWFGHLGFVPKVSLGVLINLGRTNFDRHSSVTPVIIPVPFTTEQYNALKARVEELEKENAALKDEIEALKNQAPDTVYVGSNNVESPAYAFFDMGSAKLDARQKLHLDFFCDNVVANLDENKGLVVTGSADSATGSAKRNQQLSEQRANAVKDYLVKKGVDASRIETEVLGGIDGKDDARRVVISVK
ncbi:MAG: OmpA family protein [Bacteroidales bacterium]|nr:OmpA family protein [Bacteroidales bacterium]